MTDVLIHSPFPRQDSQGNTTSALRLQRMLMESGMEVALEDVWYSGVEARWMVALNARRSAGAVAEFMDACPRGRVVVVLTGTDINHPEVQDPESDTCRTMKLADRLVVLHEASLAAVPKDFRDKCVVIHPSVQLPHGLQHKPRRGELFEVLMVGNIRREKNLPLAIEACRLLPQDAGIVVRVYGDAEGDLANRLMEATAGPLPFQWRGKTDHTSLMELMATSDLLLNTSTQEGGANAICEALGMGLPVLASRISGNVGMLGDDYEGLFPSEDAGDLAEMLSRCAENAVFYQRLKLQVCARSDQFMYQKESELWTQLISC
ncbi:glycosyltransferase [Verrucomicrobiaceae bacterium N1E253]|uniref:Glycosyltransferase n=1 Tax=Oceaniferula marina TaxID=2748318 RepID=A0A851GER4_9BACT|nr:glycosyltransferase family 4 protein [Oceaniferula marina]NWK55679.1 glycosyltransferase [Oceaniferula marina]